MFMQAKSAELAIVKVLRCHSQNITDDKLAVVVGRKDLLTTRSCFRYSISSVSNFLPGSCSALLTLEPLEIN